jgi:hypothetical protein
LREDQCVHQTKTATATVVVVATDILEPHPAEQAHLVPPQEAAHCCRFR